MLVYLLWLVLWLVISWGLPPFVKSIRREPHSKTMPPFWAMLVAFVIVGGMDYLYKNDTRLAASVRRLEKLVEHVSNGREQDALMLLRETASDPPWESKELSEPVPPSF